MRCRFLHITLSCLQDNSMVVVCRLASEGARRRLVYQPSISAMAMPDSPATL